MIDAVPSLLQHIKSGKARALAVTSAKRLPALPDVPTVAESGLPNFEMVSWYGIWGPARMPADVAAGGAKPGRAGFYLLEHQGARVRGLREAGIGEVQTAD